MEPLETVPDIESRRMELRGVVRLAGEVIAQYWPMRTFVHHNPLHSIEYLPFEEAVKRGKQFMSGNGYLPSLLYREYLKTGRIRATHLDDALKTRVIDKPVTIGSHHVTHGSVLRACLAEGLCAPVMEPLDDQLEDPDRPMIDALVRKLELVILPFSLDDRVRKVVDENRAALCRWLTLSHWCDDTLGTQIVQQINEQMIKWCGAFLDEGHATWAMPGREKGLYEAWKAMASHEWSPCGIKDSRRKIARLPDHPEDALLESLDALGIPSDLLQDYLSLQLTALPGWAGFIKWRGEERDYPWQQAYPVGLVKFLAIRLWYACELVSQACQDHLGIDGRYEAVMAYMRDYPEEYYLRRQRVAGRLPALYAEEVDRLSHRKGQSWNNVLTRYRAEVIPRLQTAVRRAAARRLLALARSLNIDATALVGSVPADLKQVVDWMEAFPESDHGPVWLKALEASYQEQLLGLLRARTEKTVPAETVRPSSQSVYCIDVRSEPFRRHLESIGPHETYGFAGFFAAFIRYRAWGKEHDTEQFPVIMRAKNEVREIPRSYLDHKVSLHAARAKWVHAGHTLLHDLKENVVTPYVMVESLGWFYGLPIFGKTLVPALYQRWTAWLRRLFVPSLPTTLTIDKLAPGETAEMLEAEQQAVIREALREQLGLRSFRITPALVEGLRQRALTVEGDPEPPIAAEEIKQAGLTPETINAFVETLRRQYDLTARSASRHRERLTRTGFTLEEQILTVDTALRMMGLTKNFARLVLFCAHGSTSDNNPYESALDCGACGGNEGKPNARALAMMANNLKVRERIAKHGINIPSDTHFLAGQMDTTTDTIQLFDLEDAPSTHRADIARLQEDLKEASALTSQERCARFPDIQQGVTETEAEAHVRRRSVDWSQVRPEWGLSNNTSFLIGRRELTKGLDLRGRVFLQSYDYREDPSARLLEVLLTAPQVVAQWINMEHYFSAVDNEVYGSGSKIYHNVVGRLGIMSGPWSDLRLGLARQTVMSGEGAYHEPMRLLTIIEAPRPRIEKLIARHEILQHFYHNEWVHLVALDPEDRVWYRYRSDGTWHPIVIALEAASVQEGIETRP
ncbi:MAG: Na-translocating system protein MpsB [Nitrospira sp.]|nr:Na-translocating system protein MpsB [Nitrospira sp.]